MIRKIKNKERENGMKYCTFCKPEKVDAIWRDGRLNFSCLEHYDQLWEEKRDSYETEAEYQISRIYGV